MDKEWINGKEGTVTISLSPVLFLESAKEYLRACIELEKQSNFPTVPFFLCCRSIELALKARHLENMTRKEVKKFYSHNLVNSYSDLDAKHKNLDSGEVALLTEANNIYSVKKFEYLNTYDAANAYKRFPNLNTLTALARKIANYYI